MCTIDPLIRQIVSSRNVSKLAIGTRRARRRRCNAKMHPRIARLHAIALGARDVDKIIAPGLDDKSAYPICRACGGYHCEKGTPFLLSVGRRKSAAINYAYR